MVVPNIPNNSLTEEIKEIVSLCQQLEPRYGKKATYFNPPATEEEIIAWENEHEITIPETYKDWLRFSNGSQLLFDLARFNDLNHLVVGNEFVSDDLVIIGTLIGDGEFLCFSKKTGKIVRHNHGKMREYDNMNKVIKKLLNIV
ncbi:MAG: SMI1/KNR4 family protein [Oscillospiraceae bacterium]|nr:SMI1/KNR4 family protein [Oscillospiraceae bacterium]